MKSVNLHIINEETGDVIAMPMAFNAPRVGDEIRLIGDKFYKVTRVVWCYDEPPPYDRVNVGVVRVGERV